MKGGSMCRGILNIIWFLLLWLFISLDVLPAEETWYLISETELQSIEQYKETSEAEKRSWLLQVQRLRERAESSEARSQRLETESGSLNNQLLQAREQNRKLETSFNKYEAAQLALNLSKNGEIAGLKTELTVEQQKVLKRDKTILQMGITIAVLGLLIIAAVILKILKAYGKIKMPWLKI
jgi:alpha-galactosidase/6-phospho-beta-glucosidase family protein